jgi:hypothetical protein
MIKAEKIPAALFALHWIMVLGRNQAIHGMESNKMFEIMDWAELLPSLIVRPHEDTTEEFRTMLGGLGERYPEFKCVVRMFDDGRTWWPEEGLPWKLEVDSPGGEYRKERANVCKHSYR